MTSILHLGECLEVMRGMPDNSVDAVVTDPPYGLAFMGKKWDYDVPDVAIWAECLRLLKPGGHLLAFAGTRTQHRMAYRIEDAGFEIRDMIAWVYGSGFPKSLDVSKAIDKSTALVSIPATDTAREWRGWGTALKPALEPITMARKPLVGTVAANVLEYGTGALNIDACRVGTDDILSFGSRQLGDGIKYGKCTPSTEGIQNPAGRWPANLIHDGSEEVTAGFPVTGASKTSWRGLQHSGRHGGLANAGRNIKDGTNSERGHNDNGGSASRFFYCAKASKAERTQDNHHPTVKPVALMRYLCRLVTPPGGIVLDPFMGSGTTGIAAKAEDLQFIGIERDPEYFAIAEARINAAQAQPELPMLTEAL